MQPQAVAAAFNQCLLFLLLNDNFLSISYELNIYQIPYLVRNLRIGILELEYLQSVLTVGNVDIALVFYYIVGRVD